MRSWFTRRDIGPRPEPPKPLHGPFRLREIELVSGQVVEVREDNIIQIRDSSIEIGDAVGVTSYFKSAIVALRYW